MFKTPTETFDSEPSNQNIFQSVPLNSFYSDTSVRQEQIIVLIVLSQKTTKTYLNT